MLVPLLLLLPFWVYGLTIMEVNDSVEGDFLETLSTQEYLIMFQADWCGGCRQYKPTFQELAQWLEQSHPHIQAVSINHDHSPKIASRFLITMLPTIYHVKDGQFRDVTMKMYALYDYFDQAGWQSQPVLQQWIKPTGTMAAVLSFLAGIHGWLVKTLGADLLRTLLLTLCLCIGALILKNIYRTIKQIRAQPRVAEKKTQ